MEPAAGRAVDEAGRVIEQERDLGPCRHLSGLQLLFWEPRRGLEQSDTSDLP